MGDSLVDWEEPEHFPTSECWCKPVEREPGLWIHRDLLDRLVGES